MGNGALVEQTEYSLPVIRDPEEVLIEAQKAAVSLKRVVEQKPKKVEIHGEQYLEFEDWQLLGKFYGLASKVVDTKAVTYPNDAQGFWARAVVIRLKDGMEVSAAESMCLNNEDNWKDKPTFQLGSMAQTRACAKALRNVLAWVVVLAGYRPTPAEELDHRQPPPTKPLAPGNDWKEMKSKYAGKCTKCERPINVFETILYSKTRGVRCSQCAPGVQQEELPA